MIDIDRLKALAEAALDYPEAPYLRCQVAFNKAANPAAVLELIAEIESLREVLAATRDARDAKDYRIDELKTENDSLRQQLAVPSDVLADCEALRLDAERYRFIKPQLAISAYTLKGIHYVDEAIDAAIAMDKGSPAE